MYVNHHAAARCEVRQVMEYDLRHAPVLARAVKFTLSSPQAYAMTEERFHRGIFGTACGPILLSAAEQSDEASRYFAMRHPASAALPLITQLPEPPLSKRASMKLTPTLVPATSGVIGGEIAGTLRADRWIEEASAVPSVDKRDPSPASAPGSRHLKPLRRRCRRKRARFQRRGRAFVENGCD
jgi:hypothetical protein